MKIRNILTSWRTLIRNVVLMHPTALIILLYCFVLCLCADAYIDENWFNPSVVAPACLVISLVIEYFFKNGRAWALLLLPLFFAMVLIPDVTDWPGSLSYRIITAVFLPLILLLYKRSCSNSMFVRHTVWTAWSLFMAVILACIAALLMTGICLTIDILFETHIIGKWSGLYLGFPYVLLCPMLFIGISEKEDIPSIRKVLEAVINWVVTPALIIYSVVLLAYTVKIVCSWSLPCGGVAIMCFIWVIFASSVVLIQPIFEKRPFSWFQVVHRYLSIPFVILLWISIIRRVGEYGVTPSRYYLILCGILMTMFTVISMVRNENLYYKVTAIAATLFLFSVIVPGIHYKSITTMSQMSRIKKYAEELHLLSDQGTLLEIPGSGIQDPKTYDKMTDAIRLVYEIDTTAFSELGNVSYITKRIEYHEPEKVSIYDPRERHIYSSEGFSQYLYLKETIRVEKDDKNGNYIVVDGRKIYFQQAFESRLKEIGAPEKISKSYLERYSSELLVWDFDDWRLVLTGLYVNVYDSGQIPQVTCVDIEGVLIK